MAFSVSPGVNVSEIDLTTVVPATSTTEGAIGGAFRWGPIGTPVMVSNEDELALRFGKPTNFNAETFFVAADFLAYGNKLFVSRAANTTDNTGVTGVLSAIANTGEATLLNAMVKNDDDFEIKQEVGFDSDVQYIARYPGALGNSLKISVCENAVQFNSTVAAGAIFPANASINVAAATINFTPGRRYAEVSIPAANSTIVDTVVSGYGNTSLNAVANALTIGDLLNVNGQFLKVSGFGAVNVESTVDGFIAKYRINLDDEYTQLSASNATSLDRYWEFYGAVDNAPGQSEFQAAFGNTSASDEVHIVIVDEGGQFNGVPGAILEVYQGLSRATGAKAADGGSIYYKTVLNESSRYVWAASDRAGAVSNTAVNVVNSSNAKPFTFRFAGGSNGADETTIALGDLARAYDVFASEQVDVSIIMAGKAIGGTVGEGIAKYIKDNVIEARKDAILTVSPPRAAVVNNVGSEAQDIVAFRNAIGSSSYLFMDSGYKYRYDKYNDVYRYVPMNGDIAGLMVRTDETRDPWFSPAGFNRGQIKNVIKLAYNPGKADRDILYKNAINPVATFPGQGTILYGDKTLLAKPSAFDRINVRRLFIVLEKAIATASKFSLFEFNDEFTRAQFRSLVEPFLRDIQGRRGIYDFRVVCDTTNNTAEVIDRNEFIGDIYIKPSRSINFIQLNFVAVRTGVEFSEVVGQF